MLSSGLSIFTLNRSPETPFTYTVIKSPLEYTITSIVAFLLKVPPNVKAAKHNGTTGR